MKINEILIEGWGNVANNLAKEFVGMKPGDEWTGPGGMFSPIGQLRAKKAQTQAQGNLQAAGQFKTNPVRATAPDTTATDTVPSGKQLQVQLAIGPGQTKPSFAYKRTNGWVNEMGQAITDPNSIKDLEDLLAGQGGKLLTIPTRKISRKRGQ
jgi:hypothetical protein